MKKFIFLFLLLLSPLFAFAQYYDECPFSYNGFVSEVKSNCGAGGNLPYCVKLAEDCAYLAKNGIPASLRFMGEVSPSILEEMFKAGLTLPFENARDVFKDELICTMVAANAKGKLPLDNFKVVWKYSGFTVQDLSEGVCYIGKTSLSYRPHELAAVLNLRGLTKFFTSLKVPYEKDIFLGIPLDIWAAKYYPTERTQRFAAALNNPSNIIYIDKDTDFSLFMPNGTQVLLVGEAHHAFYYKTAQRIIKSLKCNPGLTHFASEFLLEMQEEDIEEFRRTGDVCSIKINAERSTKKEFAKIIKEMNNMNMACLSSGGCNINYLPLERTARVLGREEKNNEKAKSDYLKLFDKKPSMSAEDYALELLKYMGRVGSSDGVAERNLEWADIISAALKKNPSAKIFAYMGKAHSIGIEQMRDSDNASLAKILRRRGFKVQAVSLSGGSYAFFTDSLIFRLGALQNKAFIFKVPAEFKADLNTDYIVHIPTDGKQESALEKWVSSHKLNYYKSYYSDDE